MALALAPDHHIVAVGRTVGALEELDDRIRARGGAATLAPMDIADPAAIGQLAQGVAERWGRVDIWAHTAIHAAPLAPGHGLVAGPRPARPVRRPRPGAAPRGGRAALSLLTPGQSSRGRPAGPGRCA